MKKTLLLLAMFSAAVGSAQAADMPVKAPVYVAPFTWTGVYLGINAGYGNSKSDGNEFCTTPTGVVGGTGCWNGSPAAVSSSGGFVGGQLGALVRGEEAVAAGRTRPKSSSFATSSIPPRLAAKMFEGLMSRWISPASCASWSARATCRSR